MIDIEAIKTRAEAATKGPWEPADTAMNYIVWAFHGNGARIMIADEVDVLEDANFISHARTDIPALTAEVERLRAIVDRVREVHAPKVQTVSVPVFDEFDSPTQTDTYCAGCGGWGSSQKLHRLCPTIRALDDQ